MPGPVTRIDSFMRKIGGRGGMSLTTGFDVVSIQFAVHYFFRNFEKLSSFLTNVNNNTKVNGYFVGTCFDGEKVFQQLSDLPKDDFIQGMINSEVIWKIKKLLQNK